MLFWLEKSLLNPFPAPYIKRGIQVSADRATSDAQEKPRTGGGVCKDLSFSRYFQRKWRNLHLKVSQMRGAGTEKQRTQFTRAFDNHEIMVIEMFSALNKLVFIEISEYWS
jgi:hypothetical protein